MEIKRERGILHGDDASGGECAVATTITFPNSAPSYFFDRDVLSFRALADGLPVECMASAELLFSHFGATGFTEEEMRKAFEEHRAELHNLARVHIENGWVDGGRVLLTTRLTRLRVTYGEGLDDFPLGREIVDSAHRVLTGIIGPSAERVDVEWSFNQDPPYPGVNVRIADPNAPYSVSGFFGPRETADPDVLSVYLARLWGSILRERSRKLTGKFG